MNIYTKFSLLVGIFTTVLQADYQLVSLHTTNNSDVMWSILICTLEERTTSLNLLVDKLQKQIATLGLQNRIEVAYCKDNREYSIGFKRNLLLKASKGKYVNFIDDDDDIHENYIFMIYQKLLSDPDCVSLTGIFTVDGKWPQTFIHSCKYSHYFHQDGVFYRPPNHLNPVRKSIAEQFIFPETNWQEDTEWALQLSRSGLLQSEAVIDEPYYFYLYKTQKETITAKNPLLVIVIMVKNEGHIGKEKPVIVETLEPFADGGIDAFFVLDTGSTDDTVAVTQQFFADRGIHHGHVAQEPFIDFATSRNRALELAEQHFPDAGFMLMIDAEWYINNVQGLLAFCSQHSIDTAANYDIRLNFGSSSFYQTRLLRASARQRFNGAVHEAIIRSNSVPIPEDVYFEVRPSDKGIEKSRERWKRDAQVLLKEYEKDPTSSRTLFYLGQTYECLGDLENAAHFYMLRTQTPGWEEENYMAEYHLARVYENMGNWPLALHHYLQAYEKRPHRAEPFAKIAEHYWQVDNKKLCYFFGKAIADVPYPKDDILFIDDEVYKYKRYEILSKCAWYVGQYAVGAEATKKAIEAHPEHAQLHTNYQYYEQKMVPGAN